MTIPIRHACWHRPGDASPHQAGWACSYCMRTTDPCCTDCHFRHASELAPAPLPDAAPARWDRRFLDLAAHVAGWSKDPSTQCGAVIVDPARRVVSLGFNGPPAGVDDTLAQGDRATKLRVTLHAEDNAILFARAPLAGCTLYVWPLPPCAPCAARIVQAGIRRVVHPAPSAEHATRWGDDWPLAARMYREGGVASEEVKKRGS